MNRVELNVISTHDDGIVQLGITIASLRRCAYHETYLYPESMAAFAESLMQFPQSQASEAVFECGSREARAHDFIRLRTFVLKSNGHSALEVDSRMRGEPPACAELHFYVPGMPADFNRVGLELSAWLQSPTERLVVEWQDG